MQLGKVQPLKAPQTAPIFASRAQRRSSRSIQISALKVGDKAPSFTLKNQDGKDVSLSKFQGFLGKPVVLYFYPSDDSPGCTKQASAFKSAFGLFKKAGAEVLGISGQDVESHVAFKSKLDLPFPLLADEGDKVRKAYGVKGDLLGLLPGRETFVVGKDGKILKIYNNQFSPESHVDEALEALAQA